LPPGTSRSGTLNQFFGDRCIFERILMAPQVAGVGSVVSQRTVTVTLWNTFRSVIKAMTAITATGPGSAILPTPTLPLVFVPLQEGSLNIIVPVQGDAIIAEFIDFSFPGEDGTTLSLSGNRLDVAAFTIPANWDDSGVDEKPQQWLTDVLKATSEREQRIQLRTIPRTQVKFRVIADALSKCLLEALLWGWQGKLYAVPFWPDAQPVLESVSAGDVTVYVDTSDRGFVAGGLLLLWRDPFTYELNQITALVAGGLQLVSPAQYFWPADGQSICIPVRKGRLAEHQDVKRTTSTVAEADLTFDCEVV